MPCPDFDPARCMKCPGDTNVVPPDMGPHSDGSIIFIGEAPGADEDDKGRPFVGKTGKELNEHYLQLAGLSRDEIYITNAVKCRPFNNKTPNQELIDTCAAWHLKSEIRKYKPRVVVLMGAVACSLIGSVDLATHHGVPREGELFGHRCTLIPFWHPASGIHDTKMMIPLREDFMFLRRVLKFNAEWIEDEYPNPDYKLINNLYDFKSYIGKCDWDQPMAIDTEYYREHGRKGGHCLGFSAIPGTGRMILASNYELVKEFARYVGLWRNVFVFHNCLADIDMLADMGIHIPTDRIDDTMTRAYNLGSFNRIGLKVLAYRLCGIVMQEFEDLVAPYAHADALEYLGKLDNDTWPKPENWPKRAWSLNTYVKRTLGDLAKCEDPTKIYQILLGRWEDWPDEIVQPAIDKYGDMPQPNVRQVPVKELITYQCRDADATLRVRRELIKLATKLRYRVRKVA